MTVKRRNHGRNRKGRGRVGTSVNCEGCGCKPPKDKAVKRFQVRNIVDNSSMRDIREASGVRCLRRAQDVCKDALLRRVRSAQKGGQRKSQRS